MIGNKIAEARKKINISQAQLAERLFISSQAVGKWERGESMPDIITFNRLGEILGVDLNYFSDSFQSTPRLLSLRMSSLMNCHPERKSLAGICHAGIG
jgi:transcriptional regulator with XRE-family HTH domain